VYTKDITALLRLLWTSKQSGILFVEPLEQQGLSWQGLFHLDKGAVKSCVVRNKADGRVLLSNDEAIRWLISQGKLNWSLEEDSQPQNPSVPLLPPPEEVHNNRGSDEYARPIFPPKHQLDSIPKRTQKGEALPLNAFASREHRQVFTLVDGRRTIEEIIYLLHKSPTAVLAILQELQTAGLIA
jgi:hypothetical protein